MGFSSCEVGRVDGTIRLIGMLLSLLGNVGEPRGNEIDSRCPQSSHLMAVSFVTLIPASLANSGHHFGILRMGHDDTRRESCFLRAIATSIGGSPNIAVGTSVVGASGS